jgi:hypothetical protein
MGAVVLHVVTGERHTCSSLAFEHHVARQKFGRGVQHKDGISLLPEQYFLGSLLSTRRCLWFITRLGDGWASHSIVSKHCAMMLLWRSRSFVFVHVFVQPRLPT